MAEQRLSKIAKDCGVGVNTLTEFLRKKGYQGDVSPNAKIPEDFYAIIVKEYSADQKVRKESERISREKSTLDKRTISIDENRMDEVVHTPEITQEKPLPEKVEKPAPPKPNIEVVPEIVSRPEPKIVGKIDIEAFKPKKAEHEIVVPQAVPEIPAPAPPVELKPVAEVKIEPEPKVEPKPEPKVEPKPEPKVEPKPEPKVEPKPEPKVEPKPEPEKVKPEPISEPAPIVPTPEIQEVIPHSEEKQTPEIIEHEPETIPGKSQDFRLEKPVGQSFKVVGKIELEKPKPPVHHKRKEQEKHETAKASEVKPEVAKHKPEAVKDKPEIKEIVKPEVPPVPEPVKPDASVQVPVPEKEELYRSNVQKLTGPTVIGKIDLSSLEKKKPQPVASSDKDKQTKKKRKRINQVKGPNQPDQARRPQQGPGGPGQQGQGQQRQGGQGQQGQGQQRPGGPGQQGQGQQRPGGPGQQGQGQQRPGGQGQGQQRPGQSNQGKGKKPVPKVVKPEITDEDVQKQIKDTLARLTTKSKSKGAKFRRQKRDDVRMRAQQAEERSEAESSILRIAEFATVNELASMMSVPVTGVISTCMSLGLFVSINQRLDAETISIVAEEFGYQVQFANAIEEDDSTEEPDAPEDLRPRPPIVTVMGHVDHGKTSLLDYIRHANVIAGEAGGITQHIGAYSVTRNDGRIITFLDTPGHEAFTAMRARGAQVTDLAIIVVSADDRVMPQTIEAINHASAAGVPIVFAINKVDKPNSNPEKIKEELANMNYLVEDWGGKYQSQEISAKYGTNVEELLEKVLLEADMLELKANPSRRAYGTVIESSLDKGKGYVATVLVQNGTMKSGDIVLAGSHTGHVKALQNERGQRIKIAGPATPVLLLGLDGAPQAGDKFQVMETEREAREIATRRTQLLREQGLRTQKHLTLEEIGRRIALGNFQEINIIVKGDVDGSVEALSDSLLKLSTPSIQVNIIHKAVGQISESDINLAAASNAIIIGFQVRPSVNARKLAEREQIDIRLYSVIYAAIEEMKDAMEGMLSPEIKEEIIATAEILEVFRITRVGNVAGCIVRDGKFTRNTKIRLIRDGIVVFQGELSSLKRHKEDVREVNTGFECGMSIHNFNDIKEGDIIEGYTQVEVKRKL